MSLIRLEPIKISAHIFKAKDSEVNLADVRAMIELDRNDVPHFATLVKYSMKVPRSLIRELREIKTQLGVDMDNA